MPTIQGTITGANINVLSSNNCYISSILTASVVVYSTPQTLGLNIIHWSDPNPVVGTLIISNIGTLFDVGTYIIEIVLNGYVRLSNPALIAVNSTTITTGLITLNKSISGGAVSGNIYIDYTPTTNIQINTSSTVTNNALSIKASGISIGLPCTYPYEPSGVNDIVNKTYADNLIANSVNTCTLNTNQTITGLKTFSPAIVVKSTSNNSILTIFADPNTGNNYIESGNNSSDTAATPMNDIIFGSYNNNHSYITLGKYGLFLQAMNGSCLYGRTDGYAFNTQSTLGVTAGLYPIGYSFDWQSPTVTFNTSYNIIQSDTIPIGVWMINGGCIIVKGSGSFTTASFTQITATIGTGTGTIHTLPMIFPIPSGYPQAQLVAPMTGITLVCQTACIINFTNFTLMNSAGNTTRSNYFTFTKIA
jgi:hypothetical protein